jgi:hypothetical protein
MVGRGWLRDVFEEADLRSGLKDGGQVLGAFIVARGEEEFVIYVRGNWIRGRGFRIIRTWRGSSGDRTFKNLQSAWSFIRKFNFLGRVTVYPAGDPELRQFVGVAPEDLGEPPVTSPLVAADIGPATAGVVIPPPAYSTHAKPEPAAE